MLFEDINGDGDIVDEADVANPPDPNTPPVLEVHQRNFYYPFGMPMKGAWNDVALPNFDYLYNGKEQDEELGLN